MKNKKIYGIGTATTFFVAMILISSAVALPVMNDADDLLKGQPETEQPKKMVMLPKTCNWSSWLLKLMGTYPQQGLFRSTLMDMTFIDKCWEYYENIEFRTQLETIKAELIFEIEKLPDPELVKEFLMIAETFSLESIAQRINSLRVGRVLEDIQTLLNVPDSYDEYNESHTPALTKLFELFYNNNFDNDSMYYPLVNSVCSLLGRISLLWVVPMAVIGGLTGLILSAFVTNVFFSPILLPMGLYIGLAESFKHDEKFRDSLIEIAISFGLIGLIVKGIPIILMQLYYSDYIMEGFAYVFNQLIAFGFFIDENGDIILLTVETVPFEPYLCFPRETWDPLRQAYILVKDQMYILDIGIKDLDMVTFDNESEYRDHVQMGIDWNVENELSDVDQWTDLEPVAGSIGGYGWSVPHKYTMTGTYYIRVRGRDNWGGLSGWSTSNCNKVIIEEKTGKTVHIPTWFFDYFPKLFNLFLNLN